MKKETTMAILRRKKQHVRSSICEEQLTQVHLSATMQRHNCHQLRRMLRSRNHWAHVTVPIEAPFAARSIGCSAAQIQPQRACSTPFRGLASEAARAPLLSPLRPRVRLSATAFLRQSEAGVRCFHSEAEYHRVADHTLLAIQDAIDEAFERYDGTGPNGSGVPTEYELNVASGVMTLSFPGKGTWVLNKQTPNRQIWWSSPLSGPKRFEFLEGAWCSTKDGLALGPLLAQELRHVHPGLEIDLAEP
jgi:frataxin